MEIKEWDHHLPRSSPRPDGRGASAFLSFLFFEVVRSPQRIDLKTDDNILWYYRIQIYEIQKMKLFEVLDVLF